MATTQRIITLSLAALFVGCDDGDGLLDQLHCRAWGGGYSAAFEKGFSRAPDACGTCGRTCALPGVEVHGCRNGACRLVACGAGYFDLDGDPKNGCECRGDSPERCLPCEIDEVAFDGLDNDCDLRVDERVDPKYELSFAASGYQAEVDGVGRARPERTRRPNGPVGGLDFWGEASITERPPESRPHCGAAEAACEGEPGRAVDCRAGDDGAPICQPVRLGGEYMPRVPPPPVDEIELPPREPTPDKPGKQHKYRDVCGDGIDGDGNGVIDDGFECRTLVPAVARTKCHGRTPSPGCPATVVSLPEDFPAPPLAPGEVAGPVAHMTRDVWLDLYEANEVQFQRFLMMAGRCDAGERNRHPLCDAVVDPAAALPATGITWCEAHDYCQWAGKRLPTEVEWLRAYGAGGLYPRVNEADPCAAEQPPQSAECGWQGVGSTTRAAGAVVRGTDARKTTSTHVFGNVAEWLFDAEVDPCELPWVGCVDGVPAYAREVPRDPVWTPAEPDLARRRLLRGGGWDSEIGALSPRSRLFALPGVPGHHYGVRCAQSATPDDPTWAPYDPTVRAEDFALCGQLPRPARVARRGGGRVLARAVDACWPEVDARGLEAWQLASLAALFTDPVRPLMLQLDHAAGAGPVVRVELGLDPGSEAFWLRGAEPAPIPAPGCTLDDCAFVTASAALHPVRRNFEVVTLALRAGRTLSASELHAASCLGAAPTTGAVWRFELELAAADVERFFGQSNAAEAACAAFECAHPVDPGLCATACTGWRLTLDAALDRLPPG